MELNDRHARDWLIKTDFTWERSLEEEERKGRQKWLFPRCCWPSGMWTQNSVSRSGNAWTLHRGALCRDVMLENCGNLRSCGGYLCRCVAHELWPNEDSNKGGFFQTMMGRHKSNDIKDFDFRKVQQNMQCCESQCGYNEANYKGMTMSITKISLVQEINSMMNLGITSLWSRLSL